MTSGRHNAATARSSADVAHSRQQRKRSDLEPHTTFVHASASPATHESPEACIRGAIASGTAITCRGCKKTRPACLSVSYPFSIHLCRARKIALVPIIIKQLSRLERNIANQFSHSQVFVCCEHRKKIPINDTMERDAAATVSLVGRSSSSSTSDSSALRRAGLDRIHPWGLVVVASRSSATAPFCRNRVMLYPSGLCAHVKKSNLETQK